MLVVGLILQAAKIFKIFERLSRGLLILQFSRASILHEGFLNLVAKGRWLQIFSRLCFDQWRVSKLR